MKIAGDWQQDPATQAVCAALVGGGHQALFVGDSRNDVLAAKAAGVQCVALSYGYNHGRPIAEENPAYVLDCLSGLLHAAEPVLLPGLAG